MQSLTELISQEVFIAIKNAQNKALLPDLETGPVPIERPQNPAHGDFACSLPLKLAKQMNMNPIEIADIITKVLSVDGVIGYAEPVLPGFINLFVNNNWILDQIDVLRQNPEEYFSQDIGEGELVQIEYVSANPTGRLHIAHARGAILGSTLANLMKLAGYNIHQEYYLNDSGSQINKFHTSIELRYRELLGESIEMPEDTYPGQDIIDISTKIKNIYGDIFLNSDLEKAQKEMFPLATELVLEGILEDVTTLGIRFDEWFSEKSLMANGELENCIKALEEQGLVQNKDGATWLLSTKLGEEKDNVLIRRDGRPTYFATDIAYHINKFQVRKFSKVINIWGADHQGQIPRLKSALSTLGIDETKLSIMLVQMVRFKQGEIAERLSKRRGNVIPVVDFVDEIGVDACRFFFLSRSHESQLEFDLDLAKKDSSDNPVYYIQYAHARISSILRLADSQGINFENGNVQDLGEPSELSLVKTILIFHDTIQTCVRNIEPHHLPHYSLELATAFHTFYQECRVISDVEDDTNVTKARLKLADATRTTLRYCLEIMGMSVPDKM